MKENFDNFIALVWPPDGSFDSPLRGYHVTPGDTGGGTKGGVIEATWDHYVSLGDVSGTLAAASDDDLKKVLYFSCWCPGGDALPSGVDIMVANGSMMTGKYPQLFEQCLGWTGTAVDGFIGPHDLARAGSADTATLIFALNGVHYAYLTTLSSWPEFKNGWTNRLAAAFAASMSALHSSAQAPTV